MLAAALTPDDAEILKDKDLMSACKARASVGARTKKGAFLCPAHEFIV